MKNSNNIADAILSKKKPRYEKLKQSEEKYRHLFEKSPLCIYITDRNGIILNVNPACVDLFGYASSSDLCGNNFKSLFSSSKDWNKYLGLLDENNFVSEFKTKLCHVNGNILDVKISTNTRKTLTDKLSGYEGFIIDITEFKRYKTKQFELEEKHRTVLENSLAATHMFTHGGVFSYVNQRFIQLLGYENSDSLIGKLFWDFIHPDDRELVKQRGLAREQAEIYPRHYHFRIIKKDGSTIWVDSRATHVEYLGYPAVVGNFIDITDIKKAEAQIRSLSRKLIDGIEKERKTLASDLHDEFGQVLTSLKFEMENLKKKYTEKNKGEINIFNRVIDTISNLAGTIRGITANLRPDLLDDMGLVTTLEWYIEDFKKHRPSIEINFKGMGFKRRLAPDIEIALYRIFQESINNILKHSKADIIDIKLTYNHPKVIFSCKDNGIGFDTTEDGLPSDGLLGIGLLSMKERVGILNGTFKLTAAKEKGTTIRVELPISKDNKNGKN